MDAHLSQLSVELLQYPVCPRRGWPVLLSGRNRFAFIDRCDEWRIAVASFSRIHSAMINPIWWWMKKGSGVQLRRGRA